MSLINVKDLTFGYDGSSDNVFENVSFQINTDWKLGFTGRNGRGKTTFLNLLLGKYKYSGAIQTSVQFEYFPFAVENKFADTIAIIENIVPTAEFWQIQKELSLLEVNDDVLYRPFNTLSGGEQVKILLASLFLKENYFLLIDEPTNHLDLHARETLKNYLQAKKGFILVSHDRMLLDNCIDHIIAINKKNIEVQKGNFTTWYANKQNQDNFELMKNEKLKKEIKRLADSARQSSNWSDKLEKTKHGTKNSGLKPDRGYIGHKSAKMMKRAKNIEARKLSAIEEKSNLLGNIESVEELKISPLHHHSKQLVSLKNVNLFYENKTVCRATFDIEQGERIALCGKNGSGKSTILKFIHDQNIKFNGDFRKCSNLITSYVPQTTSVLNKPLKVFIEESNLDESLFKSILRKLDFERSQFDKDISKLSEGQKKKLLIAKSLCEQANLYLWDEPLNFIDIFSRMQIQKALTQYKPTLLFIEHDEAFVREVATRIIHI